ncbi:MAG: hypothetical protein JWP58_2559 [Hymenobacter sp.]|nr:hypothetical protein [Hymenobacter sp.]
MEHPYPKQPNATGRPRLVWYLTLLLLAGLSGAARAQQRPAPFFAADAPAARAATASPLVARLRQYRSYTLDLASLRTTLAAAPLRNKAAVALPGTTPLVISLPLPDGTAQRFAVWEAPLLAPALAARYPTLHTYGGRGLDDPTALLSLTVSPASFQAQVLSDQPQGAAYLEMTSQADADHYLSYYAHDVTAPTAGQRGCGADQLPAVPRPARRQGGPLDPGSSNLIQPVGPTLTVYRLIVTTTKEYTNGRTNPAVLADVTALINNVRTIQERDLAVTMTLVNFHFYQVGADGGYSQASDSQMIDQNRVNVETEFGAAAFDLGHLFATSGSGLAYVGVVGTTSNGGTANTYKAGAVSGNLNRTSPASYFSTSVIAHEMGHQFSASHTFSNAQGSCSSFPTGTAWEPGKGSTIMAYTDGGCDSPSSNVIQARSDDYYHTGSLEQMRTYIEGIPTVGTKVASGNTAPTIAVPANRTIPQGTPFRLTATGADADAADAATLKYSWEEMDSGTAANLNTAQTTNSSVPLFRSLLPSLTGNVRYFPALSNYNGATGTSATERLPTVARALNLRCTVRDNHAVSGAVATNTNSSIVGGLTLSPTVTLTVSAANATPFAVTAPNTAVTWAGGTTQSVTWNGVGTKTSAVSCQAVNVRLSTDGGLSYPTLLAAGVPNADGTGTASITVPNVASATARIMVEAADNYFFDISDANFTITAVAGPAITGFSPTSGPAGTVVTITGTGFTGTTAVSFGGVAASFTVNSATQITATVPATALTGTVTVTNGSTTTGGVFMVTPVLTGVNPTSGAIGVSVVISGNSLGGATRVSFNGTETTTFTLNTSVSPNTITVTVPLGATTGPLLVYTAGGASNGITFTVLPLAVVSISPAPNARAAKEYSTVVATLNAAPNANTSTVAPLKVSSLQYGGRKAGTTTVSGNTIIFDEAARFTAGEVVQVSLTTAATSSAGAVLPAAYVSQFTVRTRTTSGVGAGANYATGTRPDYVVAGALNADAALDLVAVNQTANTVTVLLNNGTGTGFAAASGSPITVGTTPQSATLADLNNDGSLDLLVVCASGTINVLRGNGDGTFTAQTSLTGVGPVQMLAVGDLNGDGNLDLVAPQLYSNAGYAVVGLGNGSFGFAISTYTGLGIGPRAVALGDFNEDGKLDLTSANYINGSNAGTISVRLGDGAGSFMGSTELTAAGANYVVAADLTGDGHLDLASTNTYGSGSPLNAWVGTGAGTFGSAATLAMSGGGATYTLSTGDYDGNGSIDLIAPRSLYGAGAGVDLFSYAGGSFSAVTTKTGFGNQPRYVVLADLNNDRALDFITANSLGANTVSAALGVPSGNPLPVELMTFTATAKGRAVALAWATASEKNSAAFEVERSLDGNAFARIGTVAAAGSSSTPHNYELLDAQLPTGAATLYYRLRQVDADGSFSYSPVRTVAFKGAAAGLALYPNPTSASAATLTGALPGTVVTVYDALGREVTSAPADAAGTAALVLPAGLPAGVYVVRAGSQALRLTVE